MPKLTGVKAVTQRSMMSAPVFLEHSANLMSWNRAMMLDFQGINHDFPAEAKIRFFTLFNSLKRVFIYLYITLSQSEG
ncbi:hypothetical protein KCG43_01410 [Photobacterium sp. WH24]|uniref:hypothetical protein n=1 Tax=Photobacterium sp. WH24 TaxID=2827237 RepID=UPI001C47B8C5|nr:hypothetical protein [Photobacterium sp. WH24]MBV7260675.1 hypothetical protein [Photobacterium sp. WH24]